MNFIILLSSALQKCSGVWALFIFSALHFFNGAYLSIAISFVHGMSQFCAGPYSTSIWNTGSELTDPYELLSQTLLLHFSCDLSLCGNELIDARVPHLYLLSEHLLL